MTLKILGFLLPFLEVKDQATKLRGANQDFRTHIANKLLSHTSESTLTVSNFATAKNLPHHAVDKSGKPLSHFLELFSQINIELDGNKIKIQDYAKFAENFAKLDLPKSVRICVSFKNIDDTDRDENCAIVKVTHYKMPQVHKIVIDGCFMHTEWFNWLSKGTKIMIILNSNVKLFLKHPEHLQTLIIKNCVVCSRRGWAENDFPRLKRFAMQYSTTNYLTFMHGPFSYALEEYVNIKNTCKQQLGAFDPLKMLFDDSRSRTKFTKCKVMRVTGQIQDQSIIRVIKNICLDRYPLLNTLWIYSEVAANQFDFGAIKEFVKEHGFKRWQWNKISQKTKGRVLVNFSYQQQSGSKIRGELIFSKL